MAFTDSPRQLAPRPPARRLPLRGGFVLPAVLLAVATVLAVAARAQEPTLESGWVELEGAWTASGTRQVLEMGSDRTAAIVHLTGSVVLTKSGGLSRGFHSESIGFEDGRGASVGQGVWTDERGDQIFIDTRGEVTESGRHIVGTISGGTGRYAGLEGGYEFDWKYLIANPEGGIQGWGVGIKGRVWQPAAGKAAP